MTTATESPPAQPTESAATGKGVVLYDGMCPLCQRGVRVLKKLDWFHQLHYQDCRDTANLPSCDEPLDLARLLEEMHVVTPNRKRAHAGFNAFRWMAWRLPPTCWLAPFLYVPGVPWVGHRVYLWVAKNRYDLVPCKDGVCQLPRRK
ncbi:MAG: hypothetical protein C0467_24035 [Planctomycetaceae bacterium]|nr:hypothetical protein [Planctomycetaceae bacterium]